MKKAFITGITGQDGAYLAELLLAKGYEVHGLKRRSSSFNTERIDHLYQDPHDTDSSMFLHYGDLTDTSNIIRLIQQIQPDEIYNLGAMSHVRVSFDMPEYTADTDGLGALRLLEAVRLLGLSDRVKIYQASTSELYGLVQHTPQTEKTPFYPRSPYAAAKLYAYWITVNYREAYGIFASNGILFNHESPLRGETFVSRKITRAVSQMYYGLQEKLFIGNMYAKRDWGHARDYVEAMYLILQHHKADDFVVATGKTTTVKEFIIKAFKEIGVTLSFQGQGIQEVGIAESVVDANCKIIPGQQVIAVDPRYFRPTEVDLLLGDPSKAKHELGWEPSYTLSSMIKEMVQADMKAAARDLHLKDGGY